VPLACKVYELDEPLSASEVMARLRGFKRVKVERVEGEEVEVGIRVFNLERSVGGVRGVFEESSTLIVEYRDRRLAVPHSILTRFEFFRYRGRTLLIVLAGKRRADRIARTLSDPLGVEILDARIPSGKLRELHERRPGSARMVVFETLRLPGVKRLTLYGDAVSDTEVYREYSSVGETRYVVFEAGGGLVVGVSTSCTIVAFSRIEEEDFVEFVKEVIIPLTKPVPTWRPTS